MPTNTAANWPIAPSISQFTDRQFEQKAAKKTKCSVTARQPSLACRAARHLFFREHALFAPEPNPERTPTGNNRHGNVTDCAEAETHSLHAAIRPSPELIAAPIAKRIDETLGLVFIFAAQNGEQHFTRRPHECKCARPTR